MKILDLLYWKTIKTAKYPKIRRVSGQYCSKSDQMFFLEQNRPENSGVQGENNAYHNVNKVPKPFIDALIFDLIVIVVCAVFALYSSIPKVSRILLSFNLFLIDGAPAFLIKKTVRFLFLTVMLVYLTVMKKTLQFSWFS